MVYNKEICMRERRQLHRALFDVFFFLPNFREGNHCHHLAAEVKPDDPME
jgi:hypothetical protein